MKTVRTITAAATLVIVLGSTAPLYARESNAGGRNTRETSIVKVVKRLVERVFGVRTSEILMPPIPRENY